MVCATGGAQGRFGEPAVGLPYGDDWVRLEPAFPPSHIVTAGAAAGAVTATAG